MKAVKLYCGISAIYTGAAILLLCLTGTLYVSDKPKFFVLISMFGVLELVKYLVLTSECPDALKILSANVASYPYLPHKSSSDKRPKHTIKGITVMAVMTAVYHVVMVLLGASVIDNFEETFLLSVFLSVLTFLPLCLYFGPNASLGVLFNVDPSHPCAFEARLRQNLYVTLFFAWLGAAVIPLDWDRPWQKWPAPCAIGGIVGYCLSNLIDMETVQDVGQKLRDRYVV